MGIKDFFRGDRDWDRHRASGRERWPNDDRYRSESDRHAGGGEWREQQRSSNRMRSFSPSMSSDYRDGDYTRSGDDRSREDRRAWDGQRDWGEGHYAARVRGDERYGYGPRADDDESYAGRSRYSDSRWDRGGEYGSEAGGDLYREREDGGAGGARFASGRVGYGGSGSITSQTGAGLTGMFRGKGPRSYRRSDERIREEVCECLTDDPMIDASNLEVAVSNCEVTLTGTVDSRQEKRRAEDLIEEIAGVKDVHNRLRVASAQAQETTQQAKGTQAGQTIPRH